MIAGTVLRAHAGVLDALLAGAAVGCGVRVQTPRGSIEGCVSAVCGDTATLAMFGAIDGVRAGDAAFLDRAAAAMPLGAALIGRAVDARGAPLDGGPAIAGRRLPVEIAAPSPSERTAIDRPLYTGVRTIDGLLTIGRGARVGIFGPPGAGKSTLLHALARGASADAIVAGLIGERGREAEEWIRTAPPHATIVCATSDRSPAERVRAARVAMAQARLLRSRGLHVLLILDSLARYAFALRELGVAAGESAGRGGYPPGVFSEMARLVECAGSTDSGSVTLLATVLSDGDDRDPVSECARSLLDGHLQISPELARAGRFPAIDVLGSASRTMPAVAAQGQVDDAAAVRAALASLAATADARALGLMPSAAADLRALACENEVEAFLRQGPVPERPEVTLSRLAALADRLR